MKFISKLIIIVSVLYLVHGMTISILKACTCQQLVTQYDCEFQNCEWISTTSTCLQPDCATVTDADQCDQYDSCAVTDSGNCLIFTQCQDYTVTNTAQCSVKNWQCTYNATFNNDGSNTCITAVLPCSTYTDASTCAYYKCMWTAGTKGFSCVTQTCASFANQNQCISAIDMYNYRVDLCQWSNSKCISAVNATFLTNETCITNTKNIYSWDPVLNLCTSCQYLKLISIGLLFTLLI